MDNEVRKALETLTLSHDTQKKAVSLNFMGEGKRNVRVGYVIENPIWKTSYRLVLGKEKEDKPFLQGWAVVENATDEDWKDVRMALVSGRPISFQMDLYTPLYVPRPTVVPELFASLRPVAYNGDLRTPMDKALADQEDVNEDTQSRRGRRTRAAKERGDLSRRGLGRRQTEGKAPTVQRRRPNGEREILADLGDRASRRWRRRPSWATSSSTPSTSR